MKINLRQIIKKSLHRQFISYNCYGFCSNNYSGYGVSNNVEKINNILTSQQEFIRNFSIIAHIDHGKSTLSDKLLEYCKNISYQVTISGDNAQTLDTLSVERKRGITVKAQGASMFYMYNNNGYMLNLIDTPGHVDFSFEITRSLSASQGVLLLIDSSQGIEAQTIATFEMALLSELSIIPILTKIDLKTSKSDKVIKEINSFFDINESNILLTSSKTGEGINSIFKHIIDFIPPPNGICSNDCTPLILLYDSFWDMNRGVVCLVYIKNSYIRKGDIISFYHDDTNKTYQIIELGIKMPHLHELDILSTGQVGYIICNIRNTHNVKIGDTIYLVQNRKYVGNNYNKEFKLLPVVKDKNNITPINKNIEVAKCMIFACLYPVDSHNFKILQNNIEKICLSDASVKTQEISSDALGRGFRCGFLGLLHMEVFRQRIEDESGIQVLVAAPTITYKAIKNNVEYFIESPDEYPQNSHDIQFYEPMVKCTIMSSVVYENELLYLCNDYGGLDYEISYLGDKLDRILIKQNFPLVNIISDFYSQIKHVTRGHGSFDYEENGWSLIDLVKVTIKINGDPIGPLSILVGKDVSHERGKNLCERLSKCIKKQAYSVDIQATIGNKVIAKVRNKGLTKNPLIKHSKLVGGGDISRRKKVIQEHKEKLARQKELGKIKVPQQAFMEVLKTR